MTPAEIARHIPDEVVEALGAALGNTRPTWDYRAALAAGLAAWEGAHMGRQCTGCGGDPQIILPLPQETGQ